jgi:hypothetical protein
MSGRLIAAAIVIFYAVLGLWLLSPESVYSGDIGVKYVQARALADQRFTTLDIPYPGQFLDDTREFFPLRPPFVMTAGGATQAIFPPVSAVVQAVAVALGGFRGLIGLSIISAAVVLVASWKLAPRAYGIPVLLAVGLGSPLWFYAVSGWEHAPAVALGVAAFTWIWRAPLPVSRTAPFFAGALVGAGATLRDEVILLAPGLALAVWIRARGWRTLASVAAGVVVPLLLAAAVEVWWFERPAAAHLRHAVHLLQAALNVTDEPNPDVPALQPMTARERYDTVVTYWLFGRGTDAQVAGFVSALLIALFVRWKWRSSVGILLWLCAFGVTAAGDLREVVMAPKWLAGLVRVSPFVVFGILPMPRRRVGPDRPEDEARLPAVVLFTVAAYLVIAYAGVDTSGGKSLGPRLLLPLLPLLAVSSIVTMGSYLRSPARDDRAAGWVGAALVAAAIAIHVGGTIPAYLQRNADDASAVLAAGASPERIVVADDMYTAQLLFPLYDRKIIMLADTIDLGDRLGAALTAHGLHGALLVSRNPEPAVAFPPFRMERSDLHGRMVVQLWRR